MSKNEKPADFDKPLEEKYGYKAIKQARLETWENPHQNRDYTISLIIPEFTCLCPRSGFPDFATFRIRYIPDRKIVELKSLKLYINGYRDVPISHEDAANTVLNEMIRLLDPRWIEVEADFNVRGNIKAIITASYSQKEKNKQ